MEYIGVFQKLAKSKFRSSFKLSKKDKELIDRRGMAKIEEHANDLLKKRIVERLDNDGRQTPWKGHPVFIAMHATGTCCRCCIEKWYGIPEDRKLKQGEIDFFKGLIMEWIFQQNLDR
jgi:hypothetical protein